MKKLSLNKNNTRNIKNSSCLIPTPFESAITQVVHTVFFLFLCGDMSFHFIKHFFVILSTNVKGIVHTQTQKVADAARDGMMEQKHKEKKQKRRKNYQTLNDKKNNNAIQCSGCLSILWIVLDFIAYAESFAIVCVSRARFCWLLFWFDTVNPLKSYKNRRRPAKMKTKPKHWMLHIVRINTFCV